MKECLTITTSGVYGKTVVDLALKMYQLIPKVAQNSHTKQKRIFYNHDDEYICSENTEIMLALSLTEPKADPVNHTVPLAVVECSPDCAYIRPRASRLYAATHALSDFTYKPRCRLQHDLVEVV